MQQKEVLRNVLASDFRLVYFILTTMHTTYTMQQDKDILVIVTSKEIERIENQRIEKIQIIFVSWNLE